jgi:GNAT superfamily N-acetyltransferase
VTHLTGPELLAGHHLIDEFDCGDERLNAWLAERALRNQADGSSRTWVVVDGAEVTGYYASSTAVLMRALATTRAARNQPDPLPALLLGRLAVGQQWQGRGLGAALLKHFLLKAQEVSQLTGVRVLLVHAKNPRVADFYLGYGFERSPVDELTLLLLLRDIAG